LDRDGYASPSDDLPGKKIGEAAAHSVRGGLARPLKDPGPGRHHDSAELSVGNCTKESFLVGERNLLEVCAVAVRPAQVFAGNETEL